MLNSVNECVNSTIGIENVINPLRTNDWRMLLRITQLTLSWCHKVCATDSNAARLLQQSQSLWFLSAMPETVSALKAGRSRELDIQDRNGLKVDQGRASTGMRHFFGQGELPVIMGSTRLAFLIMLDAHKQDHAGRDITIATSRHTAWIVNAKKLAKSIV